MTSGSIGVRPIDDSKLFGTSSTSTSTSDGALVFDDADAADDDVVSVRFNCLSSSNSFFNFRRIMTCFVFHLCRTCLIFSSIPVIDVIPVRSVSRIGGS